MAAINDSNISKINLNYLEELNGVTFGGCEKLPVIIIPKNIKKIDDQEFYDCHAAVVIESSNLETTRDTFMRAENVTVFLGYDGITDKESSWIPYIEALYERSEWEYVNGVPTPKVNA